MMRGALLCALAAAGTERAYADTTMYVIEQVVVSVASAPGGEGERVAQIKSGDRLELIERQNEEAHIRLTNGTEGWVKASYLSPEPPLARRLADRTSEVEKLKQDVSRLESELSTVKAAKAAGTANSAPTLPISPPVQVAETASPPLRDPSPFLVPPEGRRRPMWQVVTATAIVTLLGGFGLGWRTLDRRIRRKYGGLRIY